MKTYLKKHQALLLIAPFTLLHLTCMNGSLIKKLSKQFVNLYEKDQKVSAIEFGSISQKEKSEILDYVTLHYLMDENNSKQNPIIQNPIKFIHTLIGLTYDNLSAIINKHNWEMLSQEELKELSELTLHLFKKVVTTYPEVYKSLQEHGSNETGLDNRATVLMKLKRYALECSAEYLSKLFKDFHKKEAQEFIEKYYLNADYLFTELIDTFIDLKGNKVIQAFNLHQLLAALDELNPSETLKKLIDKIIDSTLSRKKGSMS